MNKETGIFGKREEKFYEDPGNYFLAGLAQRYLGAPQFLAVLSHPGSLLNYKPVITLPTEYTPQAEQTAFQEVAQ